MFGFCFFFLFFLQISKSIVQECILREIRPMYWADKLIGRKKKMAMSSQTYWTTSIRTCQVRCDYIMWLRTELTRTQVSESAVVLSTPSTLEAEILTVNKC